MSASGRPAFPRQRRMRAEQRPPPCDDSGSLPSVRSFENGLVVLRGPICCDAGRENLNQPSALAGMLMDDLLIAVSGLALHREPPLTEPNELVLVALHGTS